MSESNIMPLHHQLLGRPKAQPPSCFSELYRLNQCYDDIRMMEAILQKVICDMAANNPEFQQCLVGAIAKSGSNVPLIGVTNGSDAQPGQVGEYIQWSQGDIAFPAGPNTQLLSMGVLQPGDWDCRAWINFSTWIHDGQTTLSPVPAGFSGDLLTIQASPEGEAVTLVTQTERASVSVPTLIPLQVATNLNGDAAAGTMLVTFAARRMR